MTTPPAPPPPAPVPASSSSVIGQRSSSARAATLWQAYSRFYTLAGRWHTGRVVGTLGFALLAPLVTFIWPDTTDAAAGLAGLWLLVSRAALGPAEDWERHRGVTTHEQFDTYVFDLHWNAAATGQVTAEENIDKAAHKHGQPAPTDWYADTKDLPRPLDIILCQRSSAVWGRGTHHTYAIVLAVLGAAVLLVGPAIGLFAHLSLSDYLLRLFLPTVPALLDTLDMARTHWLTSQRKGHVEQDADSLWAAGVADLASVSDDDCRRLQDQTYRLRTDAPRVPNWLYRLRRENDEHAMRAAADRYIAAYHAAHGQRP